MAIQFIVEDGSGLSNATSYMNLEELKQYWDNVGYDYSSLEDTTLTQLLNRSTKILDNTFMKKYPGIRYTQEQRLEWPRLGAYYVDGYWIDYRTIPQELKDATAEMVYGVAIGNADIQPLINNSQKVIEEEVQVDVIREKKVYSDPTMSIDTKDRITAVYDALKRLILNVSSTSPFIVRV